MVDILKLAEEGKISRYFRSRGKLIQAGLISHVTQRAAGKDVLFVDRHDYLVMLGLMKDLCKKYQTSVYAFCLMPNHMHVLLHPAQDNLHLFFRDLCGSYSRGFNRRYERRGHLFGGSFRQSVILDDRYLLAASLYIHLNPVRAGLVTDPGEYRFSSCRLYTQGQTRQSFIDSKFVLSLVADQEREQIARYRELLNRGRVLDSGNILEDERAIERFKTLLKDVFSSVVTRSKRKGGQAAGLFCFDGLEERIENFESLRSLRKPESMAAKKYLVEQLLARGYTRTQIADHLGISRKTVYNLLYYGGM